MTLWFFRRRRDRVVDALIKPPVPKFVGMDEALRKRTEARREQAMAMKDDAIRLETRDDRRSRIHLLGQR